MGIEENKATLKRLFDEVWNNNNLDAVNECFAENFVRYGIGGTSINLDQYKQFLVTMRQTTPDIHRSLDDMVAEGDKIAFSFTWTGTDTGGWGGRPPTGKKLSAEECYITQFENGKIVEIKQHANPMGLFQDLGIIPTMEEIQVKKQKEKTEEENKEVVRRLFQEVRNGQNYDNIHELIHPDFEYAIWKGPEGFKENNIMWRAAFPDLKRTIIEIICGDNIVSVLDEFDGTFTGEFVFDLKPTGNHVNHVMTHFFRFREGKVIEMIPIANTVGVYRQMGIEPPPGVN